MHSLINVQRILFQPWFLYLFMLIGLALPSSHAQETFNFSSLLERLVSRDHLWQPAQYKVNLFSSYDRSGSNDDDQGYIRQESDWYVIADQNSPGAITRIWSANPAGNIRIILDGSETPLIEAPFQNLFSGNLTPFVKPFVQNASNHQGPHWSYIPIPFQESCKILIDQLCYYQIETIETIHQQTVESLSLPLSDRMNQSLKSVGERFVATPSPVFLLGDTVQEFKVEQSIPAGEKILLATFEGPAILHGLRLQWDNQQPETGRQLYLTMHWDQAPQPSVSAPVFDFFGSGINTKMTGTDSSNQHYNFYPMPFEKEARIVIANDAQTASVKMNMSFFVEQAKPFAVTPLNFHAFWQRDSETEIVLPEFATPTKPVVNVNQNYVALSRQAEGHVAGISFTRTISPESDAMIFIEDYESSLGLYDTGNYGLFDLATPLSQANFVLSGGRQLFDVNEVMTRHFINAPLPFKRNVMVTTEHGNANIKKLDISSMVYWYQHQPSEAFDPPLPIGMRKFRKDLLTQPDIPVSTALISLDDRVDVEQFELDALGGIYETQDMMPYGIEWQNNQQLRFETAQDSGSLQVNMPRMEFSGFYFLKTMLTTGTTASIISLVLNETLLFHPLDLYDTSIQRKEYLSNRSVFMHASETPKVVLNILGKNTRSTGYQVGIDTIELIPTQMAPDWLELQGPFTLEHSEAFPLRRYINSLDGDRVPMGFAPQKESPSEPEKINLNNGKLAFANLIDQDELSEAFFLLTWEIEIEHPGIYRFEVDPIEQTPFLLQEENQVFSLMYEKMLVNDIVVSGNKTLRFKSETNSLAPMRFKVPLDAGLNRLTWMVKAKPDTTLNPVLFGVKPN